MNAGRSFGMSMILCLIAFLGDIQKLSNNNSYFTANAEIKNTSRVRNMVVRTHSHDNWFVCNQERFD